jgi:hypothetical protein
VECGVLSPSIAGIAGIVESGDLLSEVLFTLLVSVVG